jgi:hypothetical protein
VTYRDRREARADRLRDWADKREARSGAAFEKADAIAGMIPFGQPILVGHHSEGRHRRDLARIEGGIRAGIDHADKAKSMTSRAATIETQLAGSIYSDDPDALEQLERRVSELEAERGRVKAYNASCRKAAKAGGTGDLALLNDRERADIVSLARTCSYQVGPGGAFPAYVLANLSGNIKRNRDRIDDVKRLQARHAATEEAGGILVEQLRGGYCRVTFADKPDRSVIDELKSAGYRWGAGSWTGQADRLPEGIGA